MTYSANFPPRNVLLAWGLIPCANQTCLILLSPHAASDPVCTRCREEEAKRRAGG